MLAGVLALLALSSTAQAKPAPAPVPYTLGHEIVTNPDVYLPPRTTSETVEASAECPSGKVAISGGYTQRTNLDGTPMSARSLASPVQSKPSSTSWTFAWTGEPEASKVAVYVVCVNS